MACVSAPGFTQSSSTCLCYMDGTQNLVVGAKKERTIMLMFSSFELGLLSFQLTYPFASEVVFV